MTAIQRQRPNRQDKACRKPKTAVLTNIAECANDSHFLNYISSTLLLPLLQIDAVSLFLLYLVEMICSGLQIIYNTDEVNNALKWLLRWSILSTRDLQPVLLYWSDIFWRIHQWQSTSFWRDCFHYWQHHIYCIHFTVSVFFILHV